MSPCLCDLLDKFDREKFSGRFDINTYRAFSVDEILSKGGLVSKIRNLEPKVVFLHVGFQDLFWHKLGADDLFNKYKQVVFKVLESSTAKLCLATIIPIPGYPRLNEEISAFNDQLSSFVSKLRLGQKYQKRLFTSCNDMIDGFITRGIGKNGIQLFLSEQGLRKAWLILKYALQRSLDIQIDRNKIQNQSKYKPKYWANE